MKKNNIEKINDFLDNEDNSEKLIINQINEGIGQFYLYAISYRSKLKNIQLKLGSDEIPSYAAVDLFGLKEIEIINLTNSKKIQEQLSRKQKIIIFSDYKNFKKYLNQTITINGYDYEKDIKFFIQNILEIHDDALIRNCILTPPLIFSETSKYLTNSNGYIKDLAIEEEKNYILDIRKEIFNIKKNNNDIKKNYLMHKQEVKYKKFNFLIS